MVTWQRRYVIYYAQESLVKASFGDFKIEFVQGGIYKT